MCDEHFSRNRLVTGELELHTFYLNTSCLARKLLVHEEPYDFFRFTEHVLRYLLENVGFEVNHIQSKGGKWATCGQVLIHTIQGSKRANKPFVIRSINRIFSYLDDRKDTRDNSVNYLLLAYRPVVDVKTAGTPSLRG